MATKNVSTMKATGDAARTICKHLGLKSVTVEQVDRTIEGLRWLAEEDRFTAAKDIRLAVALGIIELSAEQRNARFLIADFTVGADRTRIYLLNPGDVFVRFGGSSHGLTVRKTASLIVREEDAGGVHDTEYDIADREVWDRIFRAACIAGYGKRRGV